MLTILLVEDDDANRDMLSRRLTRAGYRVVTAAGGRQVQAICLEESPDIVLMDISLRDVDGWEATRRLRSDSRTSRTPVIALTAHVMPEHRRLSLEAGCDDFDTKPVELPRLLAKIAALTKR